MSEIDDIRHVLRGVAQQIMQHATECPTGVLFYDAESVADFLRAVASLDLGEHRNSAERIAAESLRIRQISEIAKRIGCTVATLKHVTASRSE